MGDKKSSFTACLGLRDRYGSLKVKYPFVHCIRNIELRIKREKLIAYWQKYHEQCFLEPCEMILNSLCSIH